MKLKYKFLLAFLGVALGALVIFLYYLPYRLKYDEMKLEEEYAIMINKHFEMRGYLYVNDSLQIRPLSLKTDLGYIWMDEFIQNGDSLVKQRNSFVVAVIRGNDTYVFTPYTPLPEDE